MFFKLFFFVSAQEMLCQSQFGMKYAFDSLSNDRSFITWGVEKI